MLQALAFGALVTAGLVLAALSGPLSRARPRRGNGNGNGNGRDGREGERRSPLRCWSPAARRSINLLRNTQRTSSRRHLSTRW